MTNAADIVRQIEAQSQHHTADERFVRTVQIGDVARQGDIYVERVDASYRRGDPIADRQLAPGNSKGSRHVIDDGPELFAALSRDVLHGPVIVARERFVVRHPEHADVSLPSGTYRVGYQLDPRTRRRVAD